MTGILTVSSVPFLINPFMTLVYGDEIRSLILPCSAGINIVVRAPRPRRVQNSYAEMCAFNCQKSLSAHQSATFFNFENIFDTYRII